MARTGSVHDHAEPGTSADYASAPRHWPYLQVVPVAIAGLAAAILITGVVHRSEQDQACSQFERAAAGDAASVRREVRIAMQAVSSVRALFDATRSLDETRFRGLVAPSVAESEALMGVAYAPTAAAARARRSGGPDMPPNQSRPHRAPSRPFLAEPAPAPKGAPWAVAYAEPPRLVAALRSADLSARPAVSSAMAQAASRREPVATEPVMLPGVGRCLCVVQPLFRRGPSSGGRPEPRNRLVAYAVGILKIVPLLHTALRSQSDADIDVTIEDQTDRRRPAFVGAYRGSTYTACADVGARLRAADSRFTHTTQLEVAGRIWVTRCTPSARFISAQRHTRTVSAAIASILTWVLLCLYVTSVLRGAERARKLIAQRSTAIVELQQEIEERRSAEKDLVEAREAALEASRLKSEFVANMSHELRTPMNGIMGMADVLRHTPLSEEQLEYTSVIRQCSDSLLNLINSILDFSKIEAGRLTLETVGFNLRTLLEEVVTLLASRASEKRLELACHIPPVFPEQLQGDPTRIRQIMVNLVGNAIKFTDAGEITVEVVRRSESATHITFRLTVADTGIGIDRDRQAAIFDSFTQADGSTTRRFGGTGLGLTICRQLAELMGGSIGVTSEPGSGSAFWVELTLPKQATPVASPPVPSAIQGLRVLVVDNNATSRRILRETLNAWNVRPLEAPSGFEALDILRKAQQSEDPVALVLMDMQMPDMDGKAVAQAVLSDRRTAATPMIVLSSICAGIGRDDMRAAGFSAVLTKPVSRSSLLDAMLTVLGATGLTRPACEPAHTEPARHDLNVLLAEDNPVNRMVATRMLERHGCEVHAVENGAEALAALNGVQYDVVLMDVQMPVMDGLEAAAAVRAREEGTGRHTHIIAMTAHAMEGDRDRCIASGMDDYIAKPVRPADLEGALSRAETQGGMRSANAKPRVAHPERGAEMTIRWDHLRAMCAGDDDLVREVVQEFLDTAPEIVEAMEAAGSAGDMPTLRDRAHALKGTCLTLGADPLGETCREIEMAARSGDVESARGQIASARREFTMLAQTLHAATIDRAA